MDGRILVRNIFVLLASYFLVSGAVAAVWRPIGGTHDGAALYPLYPFEDGINTPVSHYYDPGYYPYYGGVGGWVVDGEWVLASSSSPGNVSYLFSFSSYAGQPPVVDLANNTIDVSGMWFHGVNPAYNSGSGKNDGWVYDEAIGWSVAPSYSYVDWNTGDTVIVHEGPVSFVTNGDGTYTASWSYVNTVFAGTSQMTLTFQAVPLPQAVWLFIGGVMALLGVARRRSLEKGQDRGIVGGVVCSLNPWRRNYLSNE